MTKELFIAAVVVGLPAIAEVDSADGDVPVTWVGACGLVVPTARTMVELGDSGTCTGWTFAETFAEAEFIASFAAKYQALTWVRDRRSARPGGATGWPPYPAGGA